MKKLLIFSLLLLTKYAYSINSITIINKADDNVQVSCVPNYPEWWGDPRYEGTEMAKNVDKQMRKSYPCIKGATLAPNESITWDFSNVEDPYSIQANFKGRSYVASPKEQLNFSSDFTDILKAQSQEKAKLKSSLEQLMGKR